MREIEFRAKLKADNGEHKKGDWVFGDLVRLKDGKKISTMIYGFGEVDPETVGQHTGLTDKNGKKIFEGDIVETNKRKKYEVRFYKSAWAIWNDKYKFDYEKWDFLSTFAQKIKIIGNIHDNPELLKEREGK